MEPIERFMAALLTFTASRVLTPLDDNQRKEIALDLDGARVRTREQAGQKLSYVDSVYVIEQLNAVFGYDGWSFDHTPPVHIPGDRASVQVTGTLRAAGVSRTDTGFAVAAGTKAEALETAVKAAVTDALKRCARTFGNRLGLALYDKAQEGVGWSLDAQRVISAYDDATTAETAAQVKAQVAAKWDGFDGDERAAINTAARRAAARLGGSPDPAQTGVRPTVTAAPAAPVLKPSPAVQLAVARIAVALSSRTVVAAIMACGARGTAAVPVDEAVAARRAEGVDLGDLEATLTKARGIGGLTSDHWGAAASALADFDGATDAPSINLARKKHAAAIVALPEALRGGVKAAADARAAALGAPTVASVLLAKVKAAKAPDALKALHAELEAAVTARRITSKADVDAVTDALNARADEFNERAALAAA